MTEQDERDLELMTVAAVEQYAARRGVSTARVIDEFSANGMFSALRDNYAALHLVDLGEAADFAEDVLRSANAR